MQVKSDALGDVISEPPAGVTSFVSGSRDCRVQPIAVELEEMSRCCPQIWKFFFKGDHDFYLRARASEGWRGSSSASFPARTTPAGEYSVLFGVPECEWHQQIDRHP